MTTLSHDGRSRWDGTAWIPVGAAPPPAQFQPQRKAREATGWTKPLQYAVAAWYLLQALYAITLPFVMTAPMTDYMNQVMQRQAQLNPGVAPPSADVMATITSVMTFALWAGALIGFAIAVVAITGALKRWTWVFYAVLILLGFQSASFPFTLVSAFSSSAISPVKLPIEMTITSVAFGIPAVALFIWMLVAAMKRGPWGMTRVA